MCVNLLTKESPNVLQFCDIIQPPEGSVRIVEDKSKQIELAYKWMSKGDQDYLLSVMYGVLFCKMFFFC